MSHVDEIEGLRHQNDHLNAEIVEKISELVRASTRLVSLDPTPRGPPESLREELLTHVRGLASKHELDPEGLERIFAAILDIKGTLEADSR